MAQQLLYKIVWIAVWYLVIGNTTDDQPFVLLLLLKFVFVRFTDCDRATPASKSYDIVVWDSY